MVMRKKAVSEKGLSFRVSKTIHRLQNYPKKVSMKVNDLMKSQKNSLHFPYKSDRMSVRNTKEFFLCLNLIAFVVF